MDNVKEEKKIFSVLRSFRFKKPVGRVFWVWVGYQAIKGTLTLSFIWIPLFYVWWVS